METWMIIQGAGVVGGLGGLVGAVVAFRKGKKAIAAASLVVAAGLGFVGLNATAFTTDPVEEQQAIEPEPDSELGQDDFDAPL